VGWLHGHCDESTAMYLHCSTLSVDPWRIYRMAAACGWSARGKTRSMMCTFLVWLWCSSKIDKAGDPAASFTCAKQVNKLPLTNQQEWTATAPSGAALITCMLMFLLGYMSTGGRKYPLAFVYTITEQNASLSLSLSLSLCWCKRRNFPWVLWTILYDVSEASLAKPWSQTHYALLFQLDAECCFVLQVDKP
jgi:hypothetical protein